MSTFSDFFHDPIGRRALLACILFGFGNGFVSAFVVLRKSALKVDTLSHALFPGIAVAVLLVGLSQWSALIGSVFAALFVGLGSLFVARTSRIDEDTALGILYTSAFAGGYILLNKLDLRQKLDEWLFGSIFGMSDWDLWLAFIISATAVLSLIAWQRPILIYLFEPNVAATLGVPVQLLSYGLFAMMIMVLITSLQAVGCILSVGLLVAPAATVFLFTNSARLMFIGGGLVGACGATSAFFLSYPLGWHISSTIVVVLGGLFVLSYIFSPKYGLFSQLRRN